MRIEVIGARGYPFSYASAEDLVRELGPRFVRDGHSFLVHCWEMDKARPGGVRSDRFNRIDRVFHTTPGGKISGQLIVALKASLFAARSDCDIVFYIFINSAIFSWIPRLRGKKVFVNVDGIMWKDPKWPWGIRHVFFPLGAYLALLFGTKVITDSFHMRELYERRFHVRIDWAGYGCSDLLPQARKPKSAINGGRPYYLIMSRITPHNLTDLMVEGFIRSRSSAQLLIAGHTPDSQWFRSMLERSKDKGVAFLGLIRDQEELSHLILHSKAYLHGHSLGGINPALVRVVGSDKPVICIDTPFNREVVESPNGKLQAVVFEKNAESVAQAIREFESSEKQRIDEAAELGATVRKAMSWEVIYQQYLEFFRECFR